MITSSSVRRTTNSARRTLYTVHCTTYSVRRILYDLMMDDNLDYAIYAAILIRNKVAISREREREAG